MAKLITLHNGRVKTLRNRLGGETSQSDTRKRRRDNADIVAYKQRKAELGADVSMMDMLQNGLDALIKLPSAVTGAVRRLGEERVRFTITEVVEGARISRKRTGGAVVTIKLGGSRRHEKSLRLITGEGGRIAAALMP